MKNISLVIPINEALSFFQNLSLLLQEHKITPGSFKDRYPQVFDFLHLLTTLDTREDHEKSISL